MPSWGVFFSQNHVISLYRNDAVFVLSDVIAALGYTGDKPLNQTMVNFANATGSCPVGMNNTVPSNRKAIKPESLIAVVLKVWDVKGVQADENNLRERKMIAIYIYRPTCQGSQATADHVFQVRASDAELRSRWVCKGKTPLCHWNLR